MRLEPDWLSAELERLQPAPACGRVLVACSGGLDSSVLLHACVTANIPALGAVYVNHGLHADARRWGDSVAAICADAGMLLHRLTVDVAPGNNLEARARRARYDAVAQLLRPGDRLLTAHHADDQLETVLLQLLRGAGPAGLAAMPAVRPLGAGNHLRPLLGLSREVLGDYARIHDVGYCTDPANLDDRFERNYLRSEVVPLLKARWPGVLTTTARSAQLCAQAQALCADLGRVDGAATGAGRPLDLAPLAGLPVRRWANAIRAWLQQQNMAPPNRVRLDEFVRQLRAAGGDRHPQMRYGEQQLRAFRRWLYLVPPQADVPPDWTGRLQPGEVLPLPGNLGTLAWRGNAAAGTPAQSVTVRFRRGGERLSLRADGARVSLKSVFQQHGLLPWWRDRVPLLWSGDRLVAAGDLWADPAWQRPGSDRAVALVWRGRPELCVPATA